MSLQVGSPTAQVEWGGTACTWRVGSCMMVTAAVPGVQSVRCQCLECVTMPRTGEVCWWRREWMLRQGHGRWAGMCAWRRQLHLQQRL